MRWKVFSNAKPSYVLGYKGSYQQVSKKNFKVENLVVNSNQKCQIRLTQTMKGLEFCKTYVITMPNVMPWAQVCSRRT